MSSTYNHDAILAAMVVNFWTTRLPTRDLTLAQKARNYLRATWYFYTLAAGTAEARNYRQNNTTSLTLCQWGNNRAFYNGPFLALAGGRSTPTSGCIDDRGPLFASAVQWEGFTRSGESFEQMALRTLLFNRFEHELAGSTERIYAIDSSTRDRLKNHVRGVTNEARWLFDRWTELRVRLSREMRFLGWANGVRASLLAENPNLCSSCLNGQCGQTAALYAAKFTPGTAANEAHFLFPWSNNGIRRGLTRGIAVLLPNATTPTRIQASNLAVGEPAQSCHPLQIVEESLRCACSSWFLECESQAVKTERIHSPLKRSLVPKLSLNDCSSGSS